jgi:hypothetical protein
MSNAIYGSSGMSKTQIWAASSKTQFYGTDGTGRDLYISTHNGGFCPPTEATKIEELGKTQFYSYFELFCYRHFLLPKAESERLPTDHSLKGCELYQ